MNILRWNVFAQSFKTYTVRAVRIISHDDFLWFYWKIITAGDKETTLGNKPLVFSEGHYLYGRSLEFLQLGDEHA
jgi:hypothetical protein